MNKSDSMELNKLLVGAPLLILNGNHQIWIENYKKILVFHEKELCFLTGQGKISIIGENLSIIEFTKDNMKVIGLISSIEFITEIRAKKGKSILNISLFCGKSTKGNI